MAEASRLDGAASLFSKSRKYGIRMANFLPALPLCNRWEMEADILTMTTSHLVRRSHFYSIRPKGCRRTTRTRVISTVMSNEHSLRNGSDSLPSGELKREDDVLDLGRSDAPRLCD